MNQIEFISPFMVILIMVLGIILLNSRAKYNTLKDTTRELIDAVDCLITMIEDDETAVDDIKHQIIHLKQLINRTQRLIGSALLRPSKR